MSRRAFFSVLPLLTAVLLMLPRSLAVAQHTDVSDSLWAIVMPSASAARVDMGKVVVSTSRDSVVTAFLSNTGPADIRIDTMYFAGIDAGLFSLVSGLPPFVIPEGGVQPVGFRFSPSDIGQRSATIVIHTQVDTLRQIITGEGVERLVGSVTLAIDTIRARVGEVIEIPILIQAEQNLEQSGATALQAELRFNKTLLAPVGTTPQGTIDAVDRVVTFSDMTVTPDAGGAVARPLFVALLGDAEGTPLRLEHVAAIGGEVETFQLPGYFLLIDVCQEGGARLFDATGSVALSQNRPNPFNALTVIEYELIEHGPTRLSIVDLLGRPVAILVDAVAEAGRHSVTFDASSLASGTYLCILQTPTVQKMKLMEVVK